MTLVAGGGKKFIEGITSSSGSADGGKLVATDATTGRLDASLMPNGFGILSVTATATESLTVGFVNLYNSSGYKVRKAVATAKGTKAIGYVTQAYSTGDAVTVYFDNGVLGGLSGLTPDADYYLSDTVAGGITTTPPTTGTGKIVQFVGVAKSATELMVSIEEAAELG
ncbi:hypothetical protein [Spirosoma aerolatum]|uniref:hypothetical protein n=1 Tax=Spirosoma aerolatum TaxID=1211326 RepID=UPI0009AE2589|nr:hypothetical protein [Spirosoma aerolatum]